MVIQKGSKDILLRCSGNNEAYIAMAKVHNGIRGSHVMERRWNGYYIDEDIIDQQL